MYVHESVHEAMDMLARQHAGRATYVTPRHYLDFIKHYHTLFNEKREHLEDQQRHLNQGLPPVLNLFCLSKKNTYINQKIE